MKARNLVSAACLRWKSTASLILGILAVQAVGVQTGSAQSASSLKMVPASNSAERPAALDRAVNLDLENVPVAEALQEIAKKVGLRLTFVRSLVPADLRVTVQADGIAVADAVEQVLRDTGLELMVSENGQAVLVRKPTPVEEPKAAIGTISGRVTDAESGAGVSGASVVLDGTSFGAVTGNTGRYRIADVPAGTYTIVVQQIGLAEARQSVTVEDGQEVTANFPLEVSALPLDEIVATGTAFETSMRTVPNPISLITAREIEAKQPTNITDLLRGEIPGVMAMSAGQSDFFSRIYVRGNAGGTASDVAKIYIDGVEVADPHLLSTIDPKSIERIEVVRGPQASTIYGSEAASGVLQIFTKKGTPGLARPRLELQASAGVVESDYTPSDAGTPLTQDYALGVSGGGESFSYRVGGGWTSMGEWVKHYGSKTLSFSGGLRAVQGPLTAELTARWSDRDYDFGNPPIFLRYPAGACAQCGNPDYVDNREYALSQNTMGLKLAYQATPSWQHTLILGDDQNRLAIHQPEPSYNAPADTFVRLLNQEYRRRSVRYHTAYDVALGSGVTTRLTGGVDYWSYDLQGSSARNLLDAFGQIEASASSSYTVYNEGWWNAGYFGMAELAFEDQLFVTLAARVEDNPNLGEEYGRVLAPRVGVSYVRGIGSAEFKLRAQWGKGVRPPPPVTRAGQVTSTRVYLPNPLIAPEEKSGWDAGVDVYWGSRASLSLTRFDEEAENLIHSVPVDPTVEPMLYQYQNIGVVAMKGWEVEGSVAVGRVTLGANYAYSDNVVRKVTEAVAANPNATLQTGDRTYFAPKHSGGARVTTRVGRGSVSVDANVMAGWRFLDVVALYDSTYGGDPSRGPIREYYVEYPALWKWNLRTEQAVTERWSAFVRVDNLWNDQGADLSNINVTPGRTTVMGLRWAF